MDLRQPASDHTVAAQQRIAERLPMHNTAEDERAIRGLIVRHEGAIANEGSANLAGNAWDTGRWSFIDGDAPTTVNPSLWHQAKINAEQGLYEVMEGVYQVRGLDTSVVSFVATDTGWFVIDPLTTTETATAAKRLVDEHLGVRPVHAVAYTHSHIDHYGGVLGIVDRERIESGECVVIAPDGFLHAAVEENVVAQAAMGRRATWQYGMTLPWDVRGHVDQGLSKGVPFGTSVLIAPDIVITETGQVLTVDGLDVEFQLTPGAEAPAEMHLFFPGLRALCLAENCTGTMHNVITLRGALIRDALSWSKYLDEAIEIYGDRLDLVFASHGHPHWGVDDSISHMRNHRDLYRWTHDEAMRLANLGYTPDEIAATVELPPALWEDWTCHGYYGTLSHNVRGVYQRHFGFFDGHPATLHPYPPVDAASRYLDFMGGIDAVVDKARQSFDAGDYRWVVQVLRHAVFADPTHDAARQLQADACEQLGYQSESGPWRDIYLTAAAELRTGTPTIVHHVRPSAESMGGMTPIQVFDYLAVRLEGPAALALGPRSMAWELTDTGEIVALELSNGTLHARPGRDRAAGAAEVTIRSSRRTLNLVATDELSLDDALDREELRVDGDIELLRSWWQLHGRFPMFFPIIEP